MANGNLIEMLLLMTVLLTIRVLLLYTPTVVLLLTVLPYAEPELFTERLLGLRVQHMSLPHFDCTIAYARTVLLLTIV